MSPTPPADPSLHTQPTAPICAALGAVLVACGLAASAANAGEHRPADPVSAPALQLEITPDHAAFRTSGGELAGRYNHADPFKPHVHPLVSPHGHCVTVSAPHDHRHQKGLMYGLRTREMSFWEEEALTPGDLVGRQRHVRYSDVRAAGETVGFTEVLSWEPADGGEPVFEEIRQISCRRTGAGFLWTWETALKAVRATTLTKSRWSRPAPDGRLINYHGLSVRFRRDFGGGTRNNALQLDDGPLEWNTNARPFEFATRMGATPARVTFVGSIDGIWPVPHVAVTMEQGQRNGLFVRESPYPLLSLGPSNLEERALAAGEVLRESYTVLVEDR